MSKTKSSIQNPERIILFNTFKTSDVGCMNDALWMVGHSGWMAGDTDFELISSSENWQQLSMDLLA